MQRVHIFVMARHRWMLGAYHSERVCGVLEESGRGYLYYRSDPSIVPVE